jgi:hypothetical protein
VPITATPRHAYRLERSIDGENWDADEIFGFCGGFGDLYYCKGLSVGTLYYFRIQARNGDSVKPPMRPPSLDDIPVAPTV